MAEHQSKIRRLWRWFKIASNGTLAFLLGFQKLIPLWDFILKHLGR